ncbi:hypothetical protein Are01nite_32890 [Actinoplanes regularis]|nr:hypothetical protein Are01nite_32890 [Actinoplanes regularis]
MARQNDMHIPNTKLKQRREDCGMSRAQLAGAVNKLLRAWYPKQRGLRVTSRWIKDLELGYTSLPWAERRRGLRVALRARSDRSIGLFDPRGGRDSPPTQIPVPEGPTIGASRMQAALSTGVHTSQPGITHGTTSSTASLTSIVVM